MTEQERTVMTIFMMAVVAIMVSMIWCTCDIRMDAWDLEDRIERLEASGRCQP